LRLGKTTKEKFRETSFSEERLLSPKGSNLFIDLGGAQQFDVPSSRKIGTHLEIFGQPKRHNINKCSPMISVIMALGSEGTPVTNFKEPN